MNEKTQRLKNRKSIYLIGLCWLVYTCSYIGKLSYNANINQIGEAYGASYAETGMISTFFFFMYGAGQIVNGIFCKKYNIKYVIFASLIVASAMNLLIINVPELSVMKYLWLINGAAMSFLWTSLIRLLSETLDNKDISTAILAMGTTVATGTLLVYGISAVFAALNSFKITFYIAAAIMAAVAFIWLISYNRLVYPLRAEREAEGREQASETVSLSGEKKGSGVAVIICILAFFAVANNFVKDGLTAWTPDILSSLYEVPGWLSILLTLLLPVLAIGGTAVAVKLHKKIPDFVGLCTVLFLVSSILVGVVIGFLNTSALPVTIGCFALVSCLMAGVNNVITSMVPLSLKDRINSGKLAGILNGFCYLGSTVSSYGLGLIADGFGWNAVFITLLTVTVGVTAIGAVYIATKKLCQYKGSNG